MAKKRRAHDDEAWTNAKKICRLTARQVEMARVLGMNPQKLPGLRPSPRERWKVPVGEFIEERYWKRFGDRPPDHHPHGPEPGSRGPSPPDRDTDTSEPTRDPAWQLSDLTCYLINLADDLQKWLAHGSIDPAVLPQVRDELAAVMAALDTRAPISPFPAIPLPPRPARVSPSRRGYRERAIDDDEIPF
ncbi:MAG: hypothetical protein AB1806_06095 [Acidobacteriota bacterium]